MLKVIKAPESSQYISGLIIEVHPTEVWPIDGITVGFVKRGTKSKLFASPVTYWSGRGETSQMVARVWPKGWEPEENPSPQIPYVKNEEEALALVESALQGEEA